VTHQTPIVSEGGGYNGSRSTIPEKTRQEVLVLAEAGLGRNEIARCTGLGQATLDDHCRCWPGFR
jgi:hypothetical protein